MCIVYYDSDGDGVLVLAVDALPAELPKESSEYFSTQLFPFLEKLATSDSDVSLEEQEKFLGPEMFGAMITWDGKLTSGFKYIEAMKREHTTSVSMKGDNSEVLKIEGHLFDSGIINQILDLVESHDAEYSILNLHSRVNLPELQHASLYVMIFIFMSTLYVVYVMCIYLCVICV